MPGAGAIGALYGTGVIGGGGGAGSKQLLQVQNIPADLDLTPGVSQTTAAVVSSFYTSYVRVNSFNVTGVPPDWYDLPDLKTVSPIGKTPLPIVWHPPQDARGNYSVRIDISGISTSNGYRLNTTFVFNLVLPPADSVRSSNDGSGPNALPRQTRAPLATPVAIVVPAQTGTDSGVMMGGLILAVGLALLGYNRWKNVRTDAGTGASVGKNTAQRTATDQPPKETGKK